MERRRRDQGDAEDHREQFEDPADHDASGYQRARAPARPRGVAGLVFRAVRLVVDTGIHARKWTREGAIDYMLANTGMPEGEVVTEIERYIVDPGQACAYIVGRLKILELRQRAMDGLVRRGWISVENQSPIIRGINDDPDALRIMQRALKRVGAENHYFFCGRDIVAYRAFNVPIERAWQVLNESQKGLSGVESHARLSITHYKGKTEVAAVTDEPVPGLAGAENGVVIFKILRNALAAPDRGKVCIVGRNPEAIWFDGYNDRVLFDEAGLYDYARVVDKSPEVAEVAAAVG